MRLKNLFDLRQTLGYRPKTLILFLFAISQVSAQMVKLSGTTFDPLVPSDTSRAFWGENDIVYTGAQGGKLTIVPPITPNVNTNIFDATQYYAITNNPNKLDKTRYQVLRDVNRDNMLVLSPRGTTTANLLTYKLTNLAPGAVEVRVTYCNVNNTTACGPGNIASVKGIINPDQYNTFNGDEKMPQLNATECLNAVYSGTVGANGELNFYLNNAQSIGNCKAIGFKSIEVWGTPKPKIISSSGTDMCTGEQVSLSATQAYNGTYQWQVKVGSGAWGSISGATKSSALYEATSDATYQFRLMVTISGNPYYSDPITVVSKKCCEVGNPPVPASRQTIFYDNFGRLDPTDKTGRTFYVWDYTNLVSGVPTPIEKKVTVPATQPFRMQLANPPAGFTFKATGPIVDGEYAVASYLTMTQAVNGYDGAMLDWAARVKGLITDPNPPLYYDHTGEQTNDPFGGVLLINCTPSTYNSILYEREISNLCNQKLLFFECWIAVFTNSSQNDANYKGVNVRVRLSEVGNPSNFYETPGIEANRQKDANGGVWVPVRGQLTLTTGTSFKLEIINNQNVGVEGNDLAIDDIKVMACSPPSIDSYFNTNLDQIISVCKPNGVNLMTIPTTMLKNYYLGSPNYLFQWTKTPNDVTSWQNLGTPDVAETNGSITNTSTHPAFSGLTTGGKVYFRVIAATSGTFTQKNNFQGSGNYANINEACKNYSVSEAIEANIACPLPIHLISFSGVSKGSTNLIEWATSFQMNNSHFVVERSADGKYFEELYVVKGQNSNILREYQYIDKLPIDGSNYYRLKQVDYSGKYTYSNIIYLKNKHESLGFDMYPNPNKGSFTIEISNPEMITSVEVMDVNGRVLIYASEFSEDGLVNIDGLTEGFYFVKLNQESQTSTQKVVVY